MPKLIFDIETVGSDFDGLDGTSQELLMKEVETDEERQAVRDSLGLSPLTGRIVAIGVLNPDSGKGCLFYQRQNDEQEETLDVITYMPCADEAEILNKFWETAAKYDQLITFNGHSFDCPYVMIRSATNKIKPPVNLMGYRFGDRPHFDLYDKLCNFGAVRFKRSLHLWCQAFGIESPKGDGTSGADVDRLFKEKKCRDIAIYCAGDIKATARLYQYWLDYFPPTK
ncbi:MAG TPA: ribonuclease H-like domain-containing protein [Candidatus Paceibacterota bacterium]|nr:ribonuclease H-like domain-containing protein [Candidatus Paceibacterota bacterium]